MSSDPTVPPGSAGGLSILRAHAMRRWLAVPSAVKAALYMVATTILITCMHAVIRHVSATQHPFEIAFFRSFFGLLVFLPIFLRHGTDILKTNNLHLHVARGVVQTVAMLMFFTAISLLPLAKLSALSFTSPLFASLFAILFLGERVRLRRTFALLIGFAGTLIIIRPGAVSVEAGTLLVLASSAMWAFALLFVKKLSATESSVTIVTYMNLLLTPLALIPALFVWSWPSGTELLWLFLVGALASGAHWLMTQSFRHADTSAVMPFDYVRLVWASILGFIIFAEVPTIWTLLGGAVIALSATYIAWREARVSRSRPTSVPPA